jgi:hypothetical protein
VPSRYASLSRADLAILVPELLLCGHLIDRSGMSWALAEFGREGMTQIAIEEWAAASPIYTRRMQQALGFEGDDVVTIFKSLQLDIGAPPQFMDFRFTVHDAQHGEFHLDHCGALLDVEPMGDEFVVGMCHDIEDPTFDATAVATNPKARIRPIHRPPRVPSDRHPHCAWTVEIDPSLPDVAPIAALAVTERTRAATLELDPVVPGGDGTAGYTGPLLSDLDFSAFSHSALVRMADEVCLQHHLLNLSFLLAVQARTASPTLRHGIASRQLIGIAGLTAERLHRALRLPATAAGAAQVLAVHPLVNPAAYVTATVEGTSITVARSPAHDDGAWIALCGPEHPEPLQAVVRAVDPSLDVVMTGTASAWRADVVVRDTPAKEFDEVTVTRFSGGAAFAFQPRASLPIVAG